MKNTSKKEKKGIIVSKEDHAAFQAHKEESQTAEDKAVTEIATAGKVLEELLAKHAEYKGKQNDKMARSIRRQLRKAGYYLSKREEKEPQQEEAEDVTEKTG